MSDISNGGLVNVKSYGALGDGVTDDTAAFNNALAANKSIYVPDGIFMISGIILSAWQSIIGAGKSTIIKATENSTKSFVIDSLVNAYNCSVTQLSIEGNKTKNIGMGGIRLRCDASSGTPGDSGHHISNVIIKNCNSDGISIPSITREMEVSNVLIKYCDGNGLNIEGTDNVISNVRCGAIRKNGFLITGSNNKFSNCKAYYTGFMRPVASTEKYEAGIFVAGDYNVFATCEVQECCFDGIVVCGAQNSFSGCLIDSCGLKANYMPIPHYLYAAGIHVTAYSDYTANKKFPIKNMFTGCIISNGNVSGRMKYGVLIDDKTTDKSMPPSYNVFDVTVETARRWTTNRLTDGVVFEYFVSGVNNITNSVRLNGYDYNYKLKEFDLSLIKPIYKNDDSAVTANYIVAKDVITITADGYVNTAVNKTISVRYPIVVGNIGGTKYKQPKTVIIKAKAKINSAYYDTRIRAYANTIKTNNVSKYTPLYLSKSSTDEGYQDVCLVIDVAKEFIDAIYDLYIWFYLQRTSKAISTTETLKQTLGEWKDIECWIEYDNDLPNLIPTGVEYSDEYLQLVHGEDTYQQKVGATVKLLGGANQSFTEVFAISNVYTLDLKNQSVTNFSLATADKSSKSIVFVNVPTSVNTVLSVSLHLDYTMAAAFSYPSSIIWLNNIPPVLIAGKSYLMLFESYDQGTSWLGYWTGGW